MIVALTGFMMCGKSTYGRAAAQALGWDFLDLDDHIVPGTAPGKIIRTRGEEAFRQLETEALDRVLARQGDCILALGGGTVMRAQNRDLLRGNCRVIWLKATLEESVFNPEWAYMTASRPLLAGGDREKITKLWESRIPVYESVADYTLVTSGLAPETIVDTLATIARSFIR